MRHTFELANPHAFDLPLLPGVEPATATGFAVPEWVNILPMPDENDRIVSRDYRQLVVDSMEKLVKRSNAALKKQGGGGLVDKDHRAYGWFSSGTAAIGWAEQFELRDDGIYAHVMWLDEGRKAISSGQYRYTSSVINGAQEWVLDEHGYPLRLDIYPQDIEGFGITNTPALATLAMFAADEDTMERKIIEVALTKLGLAPADVAALSALPPEQLRQRLTAGTTTRAMFTTDGEPEPEDSEDGEVEETEPTDEPADGEDAAVTPPEPTDEPAEQLRKAYARVAELEAANAKLTADAADSLVASLVHSGKVTPAQRADVLAIAQEPGGIARVTKLYGNAPQVLGASRTPRIAAATKSDAPSGVPPEAWELSADSTATVGQMAQQLKTRKLKENTRT